VKLQFLSSPFTKSACLIFRACYGVLRFVMESGAKGCEVRAPQIKTNAVLIRVHS